jgi:hypothetical protein
VGLANVDNTSDVNKPVSTAQATALGLKADKAASLSQFAATTSAQLQALLSDETGSGAAVFNVSPALTTPVITGGTINGAPLGGTTPAAGAFTTLSASSNDALLYTNTSAQSFTSATPATVTGWTKALDRVNANFNAATGVFTAPVTGYYSISGQVTFGGAVNGVGNVFQANVIANGSTVASGFAVQQGTGSIATIIPVPAVVVLLSAGQTATLQVSQNTGAARTLSASAGLTYLSISRIP